MVKLERNTLLKLIDKKSENKNWKVYLVVPPRVKYSLTKKGKTLISVLKIMAVWGQERVTKKNMKITIKYLGKISCLKMDVLNDSELRKVINKTGDKNANLSQWFNNSFLDLDLKGGSIALELTENKELYSIVTYKAAKELSKKQLNDLIRKTTEQLTDGYGEECWEIKVNNIIVKINLIDIFVEKNPISYTTEKNRTKKTIQKKSPIFSLLEKGTISKIEKYLTKEHLSEEDKWNLTPLMIAIRENYSELAVKMIALGSDINHKSGFSTPLTMAISQNNFLISEILIKNGANVNFNEPDLQLSQSFPPLFVAIQNNNVSFVKLLLKNSADINLQNASGQTVLHLSSEPNMIRYLLKNNADPSVKDYWKKTALDEAKFQLKSLEILYPENEERAIYNTKYIEIIEILEHKTTKSY